MNLAYEDHGHGEAVLFIAGQGGLGRTWDLHQVPAFRAAGYRVITFDNRGVGATADTDTFTTATMVADTAELIERLGVAPVRLVGVSMGAYIAQELMLSRPDLVSQAALMATRAATTGRASSSAGGIGTCRVRCAGPACLRGETAFAGKLFAKDSE